MINFWILSINDRNLNYIKKLNSDYWVNLADNKIETKAFLWNRWISVPKTFFIIKTKNELLEFDFKNIKHKSFVIKPVYWSKWKWILIVENLWNLKFKIWEEIVWIEFLKNHMDDILNWDYSLNNWYDNIFIEEKLIAWNWFENFCDFWLADIRIIVYNLVPVAAMVRMPTKHSFWKANLAQWWIWLWIEVWSWVINTFYKDRKIYTNSFPEEYKNLKWFQIPFWDKILLESSKTQFFVNLWYLALDWVITKEWPKILEINARAGLEIQNVCVLPLKKRLDKIKDIKVKEPEKWVELCKSLFSIKSNNSISSSKVLFLSQLAYIKNKELQKDITLDINLNSTKNFISNDLKNFISNDFEIFINKNISFKNIKFEIDKSLYNKICFWSEIVKDYYIKPISNLIIIENKVFDTINKNELTLIKELDEKLSNIDKKINIWKILKPINYFEEFNNFVKLWWKYNPIFQYDFPKNDFLNSLEKELYNINETYFKKWLELKSKFATLFVEKIEELKNKMILIKSYKNKDLENIEKYNEKLFWKLNKDLEKISKEKLFYKKDEQVLWNKVDSIYFSKYIRSFLEKNQIKHNIEINLTQTNFSRISVSRKKNKIEINIWENEIFYEKELDWIIAHEIETHLFRWINWEETWWNILKSWTANYISDEEWLAVYNSLKHYDENYEKNAMYQNYYLVSQSKLLNFEELAQIVFMFKWNDYEKVFKLTTRFKKWITNTSIKSAWAFYSKDKVYLDWYDKIKNWINNWWNISQLMIWKIKIKDIPYIYTK